MNYLLLRRPRQSGRTGKVCTTLLILTLLSLSSSKGPVNKNHTQVFEKVSSQESGINFINTIVENVGTNENLFDFDFFYNGAGVGIADLNNDGLQDIFFCGNQVDNRLFINEGGLKFKDITAASGINKGKKWSSGVTFADVNNDGWLDIYVAQGGPYQTGDRGNLLLINQQNLTFVESAKEYQLDDHGISTQSAFFDYDKDGDLDCLVVNESTLYGIDPVNFYGKLRSNASAYYGSYTHLYRNDNGKFNDVSIQSGITKPTFGLGLVVSDINEDGWPDFYIANDYYLPDAMYLNNGKGRFTDQVKERTNQISFYGMGVDISDINNDGKKDIFVLDMASSDHIRSKTLMASMSVENFDLLVNRFKYPHQYMFNSLQLNMGNNQFQNVAQLSGLAKTDWSWAGLIADFDNDSKKDIYVTNGYRKYANDNDLRAKVTEAKNAHNGKVPIEIKQELYNSMPSERLANVMYRNQSDLHFENVATHWGLEHPSFSNGAAYADLDNDGDIELVVNNIDDEAFLFKNLSTEKKLGNFLRVKTNGFNSESFAKVTIKYGDELQLIENKRVRGYLSSVEPIAHFGLGTLKRVDTVRVEWPSGDVEERYNVKVNRVIEFTQGASKSQLNNRDSKPLTTTFVPVDMGLLKLFYIHSENQYDDFKKEVLLPHKQSTLGPFISNGDVNGDGRADLYIGGASGQPGRIFIQKENGFKRMDSPAIAADAESEDMEAVFFDFDQDNDNDLYVVSGGNAFKPFAEQYSDRLYINDGLGNFSPTTNNIFGQHKFSGKSVATIDFDQDGDLDLVVGNRIEPQAYPKPVRSILYENQNGEFYDVTKDIALGLSSFGIVNKVIATDFNNDGWEDLIAVGEWSHIGMFENQRGIFKDVSKKNGLDKAKGWWFNVTETDVNNDGLKDYIVGNVGLNSKFKASAEKPFKVYANDFDGNGSFDIVLSKEYKGSYVPVRGKECSTQQMPFISEKFKTYNAFAQATIGDIYGEKLNTSYQLEATEFESILLRNKGNGMFEKIPLPVEAQAFPLLACVLKDVNADGYQDLILAGNIYNTEVESPRLDAGSGMVLIADRKGSYTPLSSTKSGLYIPGNVKDIKIVHHEDSNSDYLLAAKNNDLLSVFEVNIPPPID